MNKGAATIKCLPIMNNGAATIKMFTYNEQRGRHYQNVYLSWTKGPPLSPWQPSLPASPPAHICSLANVFLIIIINFWHSFTFFTIITITIITTIVIIIITISAPKSSPPSWMLIVHTPNRFQVLRSSHRSIHHRSLLSARVLNKIFLGYISNATVTLLQCNIVHGDSSVSGVPCNISACTPSSVVVPQLQMLFVTFFFVKLQKPWKIMLWTHSPGDPGILALIIWPRGGHAHWNIDTSVHL